MRQFWFLQDYQSNAVFSGCGVRNSVSRLTRCATEIWLTLHIIKPYYKREVTFVAEADCRGGQSLKSEGHGIMISNITRHRASTSTR